MINPFYLDFLFGSIKYYEKSFICIFNFKPFWLLLLFVFNLQILKIHIIYVVHIISNLYKLYSSSFTKLSYTTLYTHIHTHTFIYLSTYLSRFRSRYRYMMFFEKDNHSRYIPLTCSGYQCIKIYFISNSMTMLNVIVLLSLHFH